MKIDLSNATLHNPLFLAGVNFQNNLDVSKRHGLQLTYDRAEKEMIAQFNGKMVIIPSSNIATMTPSSLKAEELGIESNVQPLKALVQTNIPVNKIQAQVSTPHGHVFANEPGKVRQ